jgi:hypothetical protein
LPHWKNKEREYEWSSYRDYIDNNRWGELLSKALVLEQFKTKSEYEEFVRTSIAKISDDEFKD